MGTTLPQTWCKEGKSNEEDEVEQIIKAAAKVIKNEIMSYEHQTNFCLGIDDITFFFLSGFSFANIRHW